MNSLKAGTEIILTVQDLSFGDGIGRIEGQVCFIEGALPNEKVRAVVTDVKRKFIRAKLAEILEVSPHREIPPCPYIKECGGCQYQHLSYEQELFWKEKQVKSGLERIGKVMSENFDPIMPSPKFYGYRNSITLHQGETHGRRAWGFFKKDNVSIVKIEQCLLADESLNGQIGNIPTEPDYRDLTSLTLRCDGEGNVYDDSDNTLFQVRIDSEKLWVSSQGFFQVNLPVAGKIIERIKSWIEIGLNDELYDLHAGIGTLGLLCGQYAKMVYASEINPLSIPALEKNFTEKRGEKYALQPEAAEDAVKKWFTDSTEGRRVVILNPPRAGLSPFLSGFLAKNLTLDLIIYISCDIGRWARDINLILSQGNYRLIHVAPFDMFPRTKHIEVASCLVRK
ncbi:MAG: hypothetical protein A3G33_04835 [Omnitrophica bacterium RIFCSPLOWO2_12_FULL_44_17]|uniref:TRAM domain-containing protein n=1 Tax=Candidatus Danuiimicrobium aquiferis TaxID=1801832 RepID=A0A1G1KQR0_9BACT|nr:MAG: hypothetical protein A3B72_11045 [Omnitrophica bacterium RIFCSPHIGHO2_02_FULL_45_28]OGW88618.1 MAG: hypothetical protein A3E74_06530 [Omnitrophica bacterium RIFCSPHIGHO2_12_FULL_44_12]OGW95257.1 MAG: hypothetical protein A3G33_04835 [Omnitrophica bacterium RIFCSPLOWO2_12_FULL_44_17]OGX02352.1 MAG: hypothetical protein A3J12_10170 [Omnitrophica bacterium RIFCSPLOWO2_02_FULL_44_11]